MKRLLMLVGIFAILPNNLQAIHLGVGLSTVSSGRVQPALHYGFEINSNYSLGGMLSGVKTAAYYSNTYSLNILKIFNMGAMPLGKLNCGFGLGFAYNKKGIVENINSTTETLRVDEDHLVGPAFRIEFLPLSSLYLALEFVMGLGSASWLNGWGDEGLFAVGMTI